MSLKVTIVGGGLAGLLAGRVLRENHAVTIIERFSGGHELGAAIHLAPSAVKIANSLGFSRRRAGSISASVARTFNEKGQKLAENDMAELCHLAEAEWLFQHRADLWNEFSHLATAPSTELGLGGQPANIIWGADVIDVHVDSGDVKLADGRVVASDLVIAADGIKSIVRPLVVGDDAFRSARPSGSSAFRFTVPSETVREAVPGPFTDRLLDSTLPACLDVHIALDGSNRSVVMYCCRDFQLVNFVCIAPDDRINVQTSESWTATGTSDNLLDTCHDFEYLRPVLSKAAEVKLWQLRDQDPLPTYIKGRTVLVGDAAHAMTPHQGQGATQAVEDAEAFCLFNSSEATRESVPEILKDWDRVRRPRASTVQNITRDSQARKNPEKLFNNTRYNWSYTGARECLDRLNRGQEILSS